MAKRDVTFDIVRSLCIIEIVCIWHVKDYMDRSLIPTAFLSSFGIITDVVLSTFTFMSAYFLKNNKIDSFSDMILFYKRRIRCVFRR